MHALRAFLTGHRRIAVLVIALALCMKALLPAGYMISSGSKVLELTICNPTNTGPATARIELPVKDSSSQDGQSGHGKDHGPCAYSALSMASLGGADAPLLALAFAFILALGLTPARRLPFGQPRYLLPPLRGPPATA